ncbi:MAG: class I SAM-dependent methyltransferase [Candidatus Thorarchaeota archaeon]|nr:MAG: class I SAM-dependent methyltransferase [Candidatus Thorarchaeota archaeon]
MNLLTSWSDFYANEAPWDVCHPQRAIVELVKRREIIGNRVLDVGCGAGENSIYLAEQGFSVLGIDFTPEAVEIARRRAEKHDVYVEFFLGDVFELEEYFGEGEFESVVDSALYHTVSIEDVPRYIRQISTVLLGGGGYYMLCFSEKEPPGRGPRRVTKSEIRDSLSASFDIAYIRDTLIESRIHEKGAKAYVVSARKI